MRTRFILSILTAATALCPAGAAVAQVKSDFNGDGKADIVWRRTSYDNNRVWYMNGENVVGSVAFQGAGNTVWEIEAVGDFNADWVPDLAWRNQTTGENSIWFGYPGLQFSGASTTSAPDLNNRIAAAADFNWDGYTDLVWRNYNTGANALWYMKNNLKVNGVWLQPVTDTNWYIGGAADFDNNGYPDIVWQHLVTGQNQVWMMGGTGGTTILSVTYLPDSANPAMRPEGVADYTGDGCIDILRRDNNTNLNELWVMDCSMNVVRVAPVTSGALGTRWSIGVH